LAKSFFLGLDFAAVNGFNNQSTELEHDRLVGNGGLQEFANEWCQPCHLPCSQVFLDGGQRQALLLF